MVILQKNLIDLNTIFMLIIDQAKKKIRTKLKSCKNYLERILNIVYVFPELVIKSWYFLNNNMLFIHHIGRARLQVKINIKILRVQSNQVIKNLRRPIYLNINNIYFGNCFRILNNHQLNSKPDRLLQISQELLQRHNFRVLLLLQHNNIYFLQKCLIRMSKYLNFNLK